MPALLSTSVSGARPRDFFAWCVAFCFAAVALAASAQPSSSDRNPDADAPITVPPDVQTQPPPAVQTQPPTETWDRSWKIEKIPADDEWTRHFRIGAMVGINISASFNLKSELSFSGKEAANGIYDDGYVLVDNTGNEGDLTTFWGYDNASQYDAAHHRLVMHQTSSFSPDGHAGTEENGDPFPGFDLAYGGNLWAWGGARIGWEFGFGLLPINISGNLSASGQVIQKAYGFDTSQIFQMPVPGYRGGPDGGPWLGSQPDQLADEKVGGTIVGKRTLDVILYTFRLGPTLYWNLNDYLDMAVGGGPALGFVSGRLEYDETITTDTTSSRNSGHIDGTDVVYGGYVNATLTCHIEEHGDLYVGVQYMPLGDASISGGGREGKLNLGGQVYFTAGINWPF
jgi:hypothetical protein